MGNKLGHVMGFSRENQPLLKIQRTDLRKKNERKQWFLPLNMGVRDDFPLNQQEATMGPNPPSRLEGPQ